MSKSVPVTCRVAERSDVKAIVQVHLSSFEGFFLSSLGAHFLGLFYEGLASLEGGILLVAVEGDTVLGFVGGVTDQAHFYRRLFMRRRFRFIAAAAWATLRRPTVMPRLLRARLRAQGIIATMPGASLMTLGVAPPATGRGIGRSLVKSFETRLTESGIQFYSLTTDADDNDRTNRFYLQLGLTLNRNIVTAEGRTLNEYVRTIR